MTEEAWYQSLIDLNNTDGIEAFASVLRSGASIYGDVEPGHIIERAEQLALARMQRGGENWIASAASNRDNEAWIANERKKLYKSTNDDGNVFLIANPAAWTYRDNEDGTRTFFRSVPRATAEKVARKAKTRSTWES